MDLSPPSEHSVEDYEYLLAGRRNKRVPQSKPNGLIFPMNDTGTYFCLSSTDRQLFNQFMTETGYQSANVLDTLAKLKRILVEVPKADKLLVAEATVVEMEADSWVGITMWVSIVCFFVFFVLIIESAYYSEDQSLSPVASAFAACGLAIHFALLLLNGDCRKVKKLLSTPRFCMDPYHTRRSLDFFAVINKDLRPQCLHWKMGDFGTYVALRRFTPKQSTQLTGE